LQTRTLGFVGLGRMGAPMVRRLAEAGHHVIVHDRRPDAAADLPGNSISVAATPAAVADEAEVVFWGICPRCEAAGRSPDGGQRDEEVWQ